MPVNLTLGDRMTVQVSPYVTVHLTLLDVTPLTHSNGPRGDIQEEQDPVYDSMRP